MFKSVFGGGFAVFLLIAIFSAQGYASYPVCSEPAVLQAGSSCYHDFSSGETVYIDFTSWTDQPQAVLRINGMMYTKAAGSSIYVSSDRTERIDISGLFVTDFSANVTIEFYDEGADDDDANVYCTDSDNNDIYVMGVMTHMSSDGRETVRPDSCLDDDTLVESYCPSSTIPGMYYQECEYGCVDGACVRMPESTCTDDESADDIYQKLETKGTCTDTTGVHEDVCIDSTRLTDYTCEPLSQEPKHCGSVTYYCTSYGYDRCENGVCVKDDAGDDDTVEDPCELDGSQLNTRDECEAAGCDWASGTKGCSDYGMSTCGFDSFAEKDYECSIKASWARMWDGEISECIYCDCAWCCCPGGSDDGGDDDTTIPKCVDSDEGVNLEVKGSVTDTNSGTFFAEDKCISGTQILEYSCLNDAWYANYRDCEYGCQEGVCLPEDTEPDIVCGDGICSDSESVDSCLKDCATELYPYDANVDTCTSSSGKVYPATGEGYANWFLWGGCASEKYYHVNAGESILLNVITDSCASCVCTTPDFYIYESVDGQWVETEHVSYPYQKGMSEIKRYVPESSEIKIKATRCFYLRIYSPGEAGDDDDSDDGDSSCSDTDGGNKKHIFGVCTDVLGDHEDYCIGDSVVEYRCIASTDTTGDACNAITYNCRSNGYDGCQDGECVTGNGYCGDSTCNDGESPRNCNGDCGSAYEKIYAYQGNCSTWHSDNVFNYAPCGDTKVYKVESGVPLKFNFYGDSCDDCVCFNQNYVVYDRIGGIWKSVYSKSASRVRGFDDVFDYVPEGDEVRVIATNGCFHFNLYKEIDGKGNDDAPKDPKGCPGTKCACASYCTIAYETDESGCEVCRCVCEATGDPVSGGGSSSCEGCLADDRCVPEGTRLKYNGASSYCSVEKTLEIQKYEGGACQNNYECRSNFCSEELCVDISGDVKKNAKTIDRIMGFLKKIFSL